VRKLDELGFVWDVREAQWLERYEELRGYVAVHGDTLVPGKYCSKMSSSPLEGVLRVGVDDVGDTTQCDEDEENHRRMGGVVPQNNPILGRWVNNQRVAYKIHTRKLEFDNKWKGIEDYLMDDETKEEMERLTRMPSDMTQERIRLLEAVDFVWDVHAHVWELRYRELHDFSARYGHTDVRATGGGRRRPRQRSAGSLGIDAEKLLREASEWTTHVIDRGEDKNARLYWFRVEGTTASQGREVAIPGEESWRAKFLMSLLFRPMNI
jgi:hypothetical protein